MRKRSQPSSAGLPSEIQSGCQRVRPKPFQNGRQDFKRHSQIEKAIRSTPNLTYRLGYVVVAPRTGAYGLSFSNTPAWASRVAKSTATIKNMAIKIRSVVVDMAIS